MVHRYTQYSVSLHGNWNCNSLSKRIVVRASSSSKFVDFRRINFSQGNVSFQLSERSALCNSATIKICGRCSSCSSYASDERKVVFYSNREKLFSGSGLVRSADGKVTRDGISFNSLDGLSGSPVEASFPLGYSKLLLKVVNDGSELMESFVDVDVHVNSGNCQIRSNVDKNSDIVILCSFSFINYGGARYIRMQLMSVTGLQISNNNWINSRSIYVTMQAIAPSVMECPFSFQLPFDLPSSVHFQHGDGMGVVEYELECVLDTRESQSKKITVIQAVPYLPAPIAATFKSSTMILPKFCWPPCPQGYVTLEVFVEQPACCRGESLQLTVRTITSTETQLIRRNVQLHLQLQRTVSMWRSNKLHNFVENIGEPLLLSDYPDTAQVSFPIPATAIPSSDDRIGARPLSWRYEVCAFATYHTTNALFSKLVTWKVMVPVRIVALAPAGDENAEGARAAQLVGITAEDDDVVEIIDWSGGGSRSSPHSPGFGHVRQILGGSGAGYSRIASNSAGNDIELSQVARNSSSVSPRTPPPVKGTAPTMR